MTTWKGDARLLVRADIREMDGYVPGEQIPGAVKLNTNECPWPPSPRVLDVLRSVSPDSLRLYPDPVSRELREVAAERYGVSADEILAGNGSDDCLTILYRAFLGPGDCVAVPSPTYGLYDMLATLQGSSMVHVPFDIRDGKWSLPDALVAAKAKITIVASPNNPSATVVPPADLRRLANGVSGVLVVDEAYVDFAVREGTGESMLSLLREHPNLIVLRTFSKSYSLAGARLGLLFAAPALIKELEKVKDSYNVNALTQALGTAALRDRAYHEQLVDLTLAEKVRLMRALAERGWTWPVSGANFLFAEVGSRAGEIYRALRAEGTLVRYWAKPGLDTRLRITVGTPAQTDRLLAGLDGLGVGR